MVSPIRRHRRQQACRSAFGLIAASGAPDGCDRPDGCELCLAVATDGGPVVPAVCRRSVACARAPARWPPAMGAPSAHPLRQLGVDRRRAPHGQPALALAIRLERVVVVLVGLVVVIAVVGVVAVAPQVRRLRPASCDCGRHVIRGDALERCGRVGSPIDSVFVSCRFASASRRWLVSSPAPVQARRPAEADRVGRRSFGHSLLMRRRHWPAPRLPTETSPGRRASRSIH